MFRTGWQESNGSSRDSSAETVGTFVGPTSNIVQVGSPYWARDTRHRKENFQLLAIVLAFQSATEVQGGALGLAMATAPSGPSEGLAVDVICELVAADFIRHVI